MFPFRFPNYPLEQGLKLSSSLHQSAISQLSKLSTRTRIKTCHQRRIPWLPRGLSKLSTRTRIKTCSQTDFELTLLPLSKLSIRTRIKNIEPVQALTIMPFCRLLLLPFQGVSIGVLLPRVLPWAWGFLAFQAVIAAHTEVELISEVSLYSFDA